MMKGKKRLWMSGMGEESKEEERKRGIRRVGKRAEMDEESAALSLPPPPPPSSSSSSSLDSHSLASFRVFTSLPPIARLLNGW